jgi:hypothetical protein
MSTPPMVKLAAQRPPRSFSRSALSMSASARPRHPISWTCCAAAGCVGSAFCRRFLWRGAELGRGAGDQARPVDDGALVLAFADPVLDVEGLDAKDELASVDLD